MNINFYKIRELQLLSYHYYVDLVSNNDLLELNGYKIRNILSIVFDKKIRDLVLEDLFNENGTFLSSETKDNLFRYLSSDERIDLKNHLSTYLDYQIESDWLQTINQFLTTESINTVLIPAPIFSNDVILNQLKSFFPYKKFVDWHRYDETTTVLILDYNHGWKKQNIFTLKDSNSNAYFLKHFFENTYQRKVYSEERHLFNRMNTLTRELLLSKEILNEVKEKLVSLRPPDSLNEWDLLHESNHKNSFNPQEEVVIYFSTTNSNKHRINASFLLVKDGKYTIKTAKDLVNNSTQFVGQYDFSNIENIITQIDLSKLNKAVEKDKSLDFIIQPLWEKFNLKKEDGTLWKQLLSIKSAEYGLEKVFTEIEGISGIKRFISLNTFENTYCNPKNSTIIPREKKIFKAICLYLDLDDNYRKFIHRERNLIGGHSQELHSKLKELIKAIVELRALDQHKNDDALLEILNLSIDEIEKRVDMDFFGYTKDSLFYACIEICYEIIDKMRLKPILKIEHFTHN
jgi:hypothetical protein